KAKDKDKDNVKGKTDKPPLPPGTIIMTVDDLQKALPGWPRMIWMPLADLETLKNRLAALERQLKGDRAPAHACAMTGRLDGEYVSIRGEFAFSTKEPQTAVMLGLQGAYLTEKAELDGQSVLMDYTPDEGYSARVEKPADQHRLVLNF